MDQQILALIHGRAAAHRDRPALSTRENGGWRALTYGDLDQRSCRLSDALLARGFPPGGRIAFLAESSPDWVVAFFAAVRAGAVVVPLDTRATDRELEYLVSDCRPALAFASPRHAARAAAAGVADVIQLGGKSGATPHPQATDLSGPPHPGRERGLEEDALIVYTSGTTGKPKGVVITFANLVFEVRRLLLRLPLRSDHVFVSMLPLSHLLELTGGLFCVLFVGGEVCYAGTLLPHEMVEAIEARRATHMVTVPLFLKLLQQEIHRREAAGQPLPAEALRSFQMFVCGGAAVTPEVERFFDERGVPVLQGYGLTECGPVVALNDPEDRRRGSVGRALDGIEVRIAATGEILTRGPHIGRGYLTASGVEGLTDHDGWFHTGDSGAVDADGILQVTGRLKELIVLGDGNKVHPEEVEAALATSAAVGEACVLGRAAREGLRAGTDEVWAVVVPRTGPGGRASDEEVRLEVERVGAGLSPFKRPVRVVLRTEPLPRTALGKLRRAEVAASLEGRG